MVMAFDKRGEQVPEYQGQYQDVKGSILENAPPNAVFGCLSDYDPTWRTVPREKW